MRIFEASKPRSAAVWFKWLRAGALRVLGVVLVNLAVLAVCLVVLELCFGAWFDSGRINRLLIPRNIDGEHDVGDLYSGREHVRYKRDRYGLRGAYSRPDRIGILTVGGSTTDQLYLDEDDTWQTVLARCLGSAGKPMSVVNAGVNGQSTWGHVFAFDWWFAEIPKLAPRYILFLVGINDVYAEPRAYDVFKEDHRRHDLWWQIKQRSALFNMFRVLKGAYDARVKYEVTHRRIDPSSVVWTDEPLVADHEAYMHDRAAAYGNRLRLLAKRTRALGAEPIFVTQTGLDGRLVAGRVQGNAAVITMAVPVNGVDLYFMRQILARETMRVCTQVGGICLDAANDLPLQQGTDVYDFIHHTPQGAKKLGEYMCRALVQRGIR